MMQCPVPGCTRVPRPGELLCGPHWRPLPAPLKTDVWRTWRAFIHARDVAGKLAARREYLAAREAAIEAAHASEAPLL